MDVTGKITAANYSRSVDTKKDKKSSGYDMGLSDFFKIMAAQLKYQDPNNPMDTDKMVSSMLQTQVIGTLAKVTESMAVLQKSSEFKFVSDLYGKQITINDRKENKKITGKVDGIVLGPVPEVIIEGKKYSAGDIVGIGNTGNFTEGNNDE